MSESSVLSGVAGQTIVTEVSAKEKLILALLKKMDLMKAGQLRGGMLLESDWQVVREAALAAGFPKMANKAAAGCNSPISHDEAVALLESAQQEDNIEWLTPTLRLVVLSPQEKSTGVRRWLEKREGLASLYFPQLNSYLTKTDMIAYLIGFSRKWGLGKCLELTRQHARGCLYEVLVEAIPMCIKRRDFLTVFSLCGEGNIKLAEAQVQEIVGYAEKGCNHFGFLGAYRHSESTPNPEIVQKMFRCALEKSRSLQIVKDYLVLLRREKLTDAEVETFVLSFTTLGFEHDYEYITVRDVLSLNGQLSPDTKEKFVAALVNTGVLDVIAEATKGLLGRELNDADYLKIAEVLNRE